MPRTPLWKSIAETLTAEIGGGLYRPGDKLPTEAALAARFGVNRHTLRRALGAMADEGLVHSRRGAGVFVAAIPTEYEISKRVRYHQNLERAGRAGTREVLRLETRIAKNEEREALRLKAGSLVHIYECISSADDAPIAHTISAFPAKRMPDLCNFLRENPSVTAALKASGIEDHIRASTKLTAALARGIQANHLRVRDGDPVLKSTGINVDTLGLPVEYGQTWWVGDRVTLTLSNESA